VESGHVNAYLPVSRGCPWPSTSWSVANKSCPIFLSTLILRSVFSTQAFAAGANFFAPALCEIAPSVAKVFFAEVLRLWRVLYSP